MCTSDQRMDRLSIYRGKDLTDLLLVTFKKYFEILLYLQKSCKDSTSRVEFINLLFIFLKYFELRYNGHIALC